jgi:hypothetical protein
MRKVATYHSLETLPHAYQALFDASSHARGFFLSLEWFDNLIRHSLSSQYSVRLFGFEDASTGQVSALLPMCFLHSQTSWIAPRRLIAASNYYTSLFSLVLDDEQTLSHENLHSFIRGIVRDTPPWDCIDLHPMSKDSDQFDLITTAFRRSGTFVQTYFCFGNWYLKVNGRSFQEYFSTVPSRLRNTIERKRRQLEKSHGLHIKLIHSLTDLNIAIQAYEQVYQASWKLPEAHPQFIAGLIRTCAEQGWLRLGIAYVGDQAVATQLWIVREKVASIYKLAYDEKFATFSIGSILTSRMMEHVIDIDQVEEVDYLTGDDDYKKDWMSHRRERWGLVAFNRRTLKGNALAGWHFGRNALKNVLRKLR